MFFWVVLNKYLKKNYCDIWNQHLKICLNAKNCAKQNKPKQINNNKKFFSDQECLIWVF